MRRKRTGPRRYATWSDYTGLYHGHTVPEEAFDTVCRQAGRWLDALSFERISTAYAPVISIRMATCAVCDVLYVYEADRGHNATDAPLDHGEVAFATGGDLTLRNKVLRAAHNHLWATGILSTAVRYG